MVVSAEYLTKLAAVQRGEQIKGACDKRGCTREAHTRVDGGLLCGCWCDEHFEELIHECRSRSW